MTNRWNTEVGLDAYFEAISGKTAALFSLACALGAKSVAGIDGWIDAAEEAGKHLGIAYQIYDDLCDWFMSEKTPGRRSGRISYPANRPFRSSRYLRRWTRRAQTYSPKIFPRKIPKK